MSEQHEIVHIIAQQVDRLFAESLDRGALERAESGHWSADLWRECEAMGLPRLLVPEAMGGSGLPWSAAMVLFKLLGRHCVPLPLGETIVAARLLADAGLDVPEGPLTLALAHDTGLGPVPWASAASHLVVVRDADACRTIDCYHLDPAAVTPGRNIARDPRDGVDLSGLAKLSSGTIASDEPVAQLPEGALLRAGQMAGALAEVTRMSVEYANTRVQFGKPIRAFQAVQQSLAVLAIETAAADVAASAAAAARDRGPAHFDIAVAKVRAGMAASTGSALGHQAHGAIGFTDEYSLHYLTRRLLSWRCEFGSERYWATLLGQRVIASGKALWPIITDAETAL